MTRGKASVMFLLGLMALVAITTGSTEDCRDIDNDCGIYYEDNKDLCKTNELFNSVCKKTCWSCSTVSLAVSTRINIRLRNGSTAHEGRVEVMHDGIWGTVCSDNFTEDNNAAAVVCSMLDIPGPALYAEPFSFGPGRGPIWLDDVVCQGYEPSITMCETNPIGDENCDHRQDVGVRCGVGCPAPFMFENSGTICALFAGERLYEPARAYCSDLMGELLDPTQGPSAWIDGVLSNLDLPPQNKKLWVSNDTSVPGQCVVYGIGGVITEPCNRNYSSVCVKI